ncbi:sensor histidine kinase [Paenibacillus roseipurpureus]|uniref:histidine kinase n=1 Tax=Paenibacillus roseopurpureus TaxID=2918901 RepID=A0AA96RLI0_9BACL|nr:histidine kinase [Paenibacillus sp. MBLB1832]WNR45680.1 histidine kinase [Paenibacillus sp. MBLB1832]
MMNRYSIRLKMAAAFLLICVISVSLTGTLLYNHYKQSAIRDFQLTSSDATDRIAFHLEYYLRQTMQSTWNMLGEADMQKFLVNESTSDGEKNTVQEMLRRYRAFNSVSVSGVHILKENGMFVSVADQDLSVRKSSFLRERFQLREMDYQFFAYQNFYTNKPETAISMSIPVYNLTNGRLSGRLILDLDMNPIEDIVSRAPLGQKGHFYIITTSNQMVFHQDRSMIGQTMDTVPELRNLRLDNFPQFGLQKLNGKQVLVGVSPVSRTDWSIVYVIPFSSFASGLQTIKYYTLGVIAAISFVILIIVPFVATRFVRPIRQLMQLHERVERGDWDIEVEFVPGKDEFQLLRRRFYLMTKRLKRLMETVTDLRLGQLQLQLQQKEAFLQALQNQINPHFLYNTLGIIKSMAFMEGNENIVQMTQSLAQFYRYTAKMQHVEVTLRDELDHLKHYLDIAHFRFQEDFVSEMIINEKYMSCRVVKLTLQPLVENAVKYAIEPKGGKGTIRLNAYHTDQKLIIEIFNSGEGIEQDVLQRLKEKLKEVSDHPTGYAGEQGLGLANVHARLILQYGEGNGVYLESFPNRGTVVTVILPFKSAS